jgi:uncharacterized protein (TIGR00251 family)
MSGTADCILSVKVSPGASKDAVAGLMEDGATWRIRIAAPPVDGKANDALIRFLSRLLGVPRSAITIRRGSSGRSKDLLVSGLSYLDASALLTAASP